MATKAVQADLKPKLQQKRTGGKRGVCVKSATADPRTLQVVNIREARSNLPQIVNSVATGSSRGVVVGRRGRPAAAIVSHEWLEVLQRHGNKKRKLAVLIVEELLADAPLHLKRPAVDELSRLPESDLSKLWKIEALPLAKGQLASLQAKLAHPDALTRLVRRFDVATAINKAREAGLYDTAEDATSRLAGDVSGATG